MNLLQTVNNMSLEYKLAHNAFDKKWAECQEVDAAGGKGKFPKDEWDKVVDKGLTFATKCHNLLVMGMLIVKEEE